MAQSGAGCLGREFDCIRAVDVVGHGMLPSIWSSYRTDRRLHDLNISSASPRTRHHHHPNQFVVNDQALRAGLLANCTTMTGRLERCRPKQGAVVRLVGGSSLGLLNPSGERRPGGMVTTNGQTEHMHMCIV